MTNQSLAGVPKSAVRGVASGVFFMAFFSTLWAAIGVMGLDGWGGPWPPLLSLLVGIGLLLGGVSLVVSSRHVSEHSMPIDSDGKRTGKLFALTFATEGLLIGVASVVCNLLNRFDLFFPIMAIIVGVHFFPLANLFGVKQYYLVGALLCVLAVLTLLLVPHRARFGGQEVTAQWVVLGFGAALILWCVGIGLWMLASKLLGSAKRVQRAKV